MKNLTIKTNIMFMLFILIGFCSCKKYLDLKPDASLSTLESLDDLQAFLDNVNVLNNFYPTLTEYGSDNHYMTDAVYNALNSSDAYKFIYVYQKCDIIELGIANWPYQPILYANTALDELSDLKRTNENQVLYDNIKGSALFFRAYYHYAVSQLYGQPYKSSSASSDLGIPLRLTSDFSVKSTRSSVKITYDQILKDFKESISLLPVTSLVKTRPSKTAAYGAIARTYLAMLEYDSAGYYANKCLEHNNALMDFNLLDTLALAPIKRFNDEVVFHIRSNVFESGNLAARRAKVDSNLYRSYDQNDLRRVVFFQKNVDNTFSFKGDYDGQGISRGLVFGGIVSDEMYLIRAESYARKGNVELAMKDLNALMINRWKKDLFIPFTANNPDEALTKILSERRKELFYRGTRWTDLRRLKDELGHSVIPRRIINGQVFELLPNSPQYTLQIPTRVIELTGMQQNP